MWSAQFLPLYLCFAQEEPLLYEPPSAAAHVLQAAPRRTCKRHRANPHDDDSQQALQPPRLRGYFLHMTLICYCVFDKNKKNKPRTENKVFYPIWLKWMWVRKLFAESFHSIYWKYTCSASDFVIREKLILCWRTLYTVATGYVFVHF